MELKLNSKRKIGNQAVLLIVPYGIETRPAASAPAPPRTFNRTLWN